MQYYFDDLATYLNTDDIQLISLPMQKSYSSSLDMLTLYTTNANNIINFYLTLQTNDYFNMEPYNDISSYSLMHLSILNSDNKYIGLFNQELEDAYVNVGVLREHLYKYYLTVPVNYITYNNINYLILDYLPYYETSNGIRGLLYDTQYTSGSAYTGKVYSSFYTIPFNSVSNNGGSYGVGEGLYRYGDSSGNSYLDTYTFNNINFNNFDISGGRFYRGFGGSARLVGSRPLGNFATDMINATWSRPLNGTDGFLVNGVSATFSGGQSYYYSDIGLSTALDNIPWRHFARPTSTPGVYHLDLYSLVCSTGSLFGFMTYYKDNKNLLNVFNAHNTDDIYDDILNSTYNTGFFGSFSSYNLFSPLSGFGSLYFSNPFLNIWGRDIIDESTFKPSFGDNFIEADIFVNQDYSNISYQDTNFKLALAVVPTNAVPSFSLTTLVDFANSFDNFLNLNFLSVSVLSILCLFMGISFVSLIKGLF